ncbi:hypothetical protein VTO42DRAFT_9003 [Malbranchea cinnamomea]
MRDDNEARAFTVGAMMTLGWAVFSFYPITVFLVVEAPRWKKGYAVNTVFVFMTWFIFMIGIYLQRRDEKRANLLRESDEKNRKLGNDSKPDNECVETKE